jgi:phosphate transport system ATP-binding protein
MADGRAISLDERRSRATGPVGRAAVIGACDSDGCTARRLGEAPPGAVLSVRDLCVAYGGRVVLEDVDLDVLEDRVTALIGPSGCGKTSFLFALNRLSELVGGCEVTGRVRFAGSDLGDTPDVGWLRRSIGMVFQRPNPFPISVRDNLRLPLREHGCARSEVEDRVRRGLEMVGLWKEVESRLGESALALSGGQQQRLCIARALTLRPRLLLMDEPCSALDPLATETIERLIDEMRDDLGIVIVTHNLAQARRVADDVAVFWNRDGSGCVIESGDAATLFASPRQPHTAAYLAGLRG